MKKLQADTDFKGTVSAIELDVTDETFLGLLRKSKEPRLVLVSSSVGSISQAADPSSKYYI